jgi:hypothetical protein
MPRAQACGMTLNVWEKLPFRKQRAFFGTPPWATNDLRSEYGEADTSNSFRNHNFSSAACARVKAGRSDVPCRRK